MSRPNSITFAVIIKITSKTSTTSTRGTTLMSDIAEGPPNRRPRLPPSLPLNENATMLAAEIAFRQILELDGEVFHARTHLSDTRAEHFVEDSRGDGSRESDGSGYQCFGDPGRDRAQTRAACSAQPL